MNHSLNVVLHLNKIKATESFFFILKKKIRHYRVDFSSKYNCKKKKELTIRYLFEP